VSEAYDAILMNPPFGEASERMIALADRFFPSWNKNLLCAFIDCFLSQLSSGGLLGSVIDRTAAIKTTYERFRREVLLPEGRLQTQVNLGWGVLDDASVEVAAVVTAAGDTKSPGVFFDVTRISLHEKASALRMGCRASLAGVLDDTAYVSSPSLSKSYPTPSSLSTSAMAAKCLQPFAISEGCRMFGLRRHSFQSERHFRLAWEVPLSDGIGFNTHRWAWLFNGGEYCPFYNEERDIVLYGRDGSEVVGHESVTFRSLPLHGLPGIGYGKRGDFIDTQILPPGHVLTVEGEGAPVEREDDRTTLRLSLEATCSPMGSAFTVDSTSTRATSMRFQRRLPQKRTQRES